MPIVSFGKNNVSICFDFKKKLLSISNENEKDSVLLFDVSSLINSLEKENDSDITLFCKKMTLTSGNSSLSAKIIFDDLHFQNQNDTIDQLGFTANIFIRRY